MTNPISINVEDTEVVTVQVPSEISVLTVQVPGTPGAKGNSGDKGDKGDPGADGEDGPAGPPNTITVGTVSTLATGASATASLTGTSPNQVLNLGLPRGAQGDKGDKGNTGDPGPANAITIGTVTTGATGANAAASLTGTSPNQVLNLTLPRGATGNTGPANTLAIGTVSTLAAGASATATITGTSPNQTLNLGLPAGATGSAGPANVLTVGTVTTLPTGSSASVTITGTAPNQTINFSIPTGPQGNPGAGAPDATTTSKGSVQLAGDFGGTATSPTVISGANHTHTSSQISDATTVGKSLITAVDAAAARTVIGAGTSNLALGTTSTTAKAGDYAPPIDGVAATGTMRTLGTGAQQAAAGNHTHTSSAITDASSAATASKIVVRDANGRAQVADPSAAADIATKNYVDTKVPTVSDATSTTKGVTKLAGDFGGTADSPTVISGANHVHTSAQISDATNVATANVVVKRDQYANANFNEVIVSGQTTTASAARKDYVDAQVATRVATSDLQETVRDTIGAALVAGSNITITPNDAADTITIASTGGGSGSGNVLYLGQTDTVPANTPANTVIVRPGTPYGDEQARDAIGTALTAGSGISIVTDDTNDTITVGLLPVYQKAIANGVASLDSSGNVPATQLANTPGYNYPVKTYFKQSNTTRSSTTTPTADPDLVATVATGYYVVEAELRFQPGSTTANSYWTTGGSAVFANSQNMTWLLTNTAGTSSASLGIISCQAAVTNTATTQGSGYIYRVNIFLGVSTAGTFSINWCQNTSSTTGQTLLFGSWMRLNKVG